MKQWVKDGIVEIARDVLEDRGGGPGFPLMVSMEVQKRRPDIWEHIRRYRRHDPHQYIAIHARRTLNGVGARER